MKGCQASDNIRFQVDITILFTDTHEFKILISLSEKKVNDPKQFFFEMIRFPIRGMHWIVIYYLNLFLSLVLGLFY